MKAFFAALVLAAIPCGRAPSDDPVQAYVAFAQAAQQDPNAAFNALSLNTRGILDERARSISRASGGAVKPETASRVFNGRNRPQPISEVKLASNDGAVAVLRVSTGGAPEEVRMVKEPAGWKVDLSAQLQK